MPPADTTNPPADVSQSKLYTREEFARRVGVSPWVLRRYHYDGTFRAFVTPQKGGRGKRALYTESQVADFRRMNAAPVPHRLHYGGLYTPEQAQACFKAFDEGKTRRWCVVNLGFLPESVIALWERYESLEQGLSISQPILNELNALPALDGPLPIQTSEDLLVVVRDASDRLVSLEGEMKEETCSTPSCKSEPTYCAHCVAATIKAERASLKAACAKAFEDGRAAVLAELHARVAAEQNETGAVAETTAPAPSAARESDSPATTATLPGAHAPDARRSPPRPAGAR